MKEPKNITRMVPDPKWSSLLSTLSLEELIHLMALHVNKREILEILDAATSNRKEELLYFLDYFQDKQRQELENLKKIMASSKMSGQHNTK